MSGMNPVGTTGSDSLGGKVYIGTVVANDDSVYDGQRRQRLQVTIPKVLDPEDGYDSDTLPWLLPKAAVADHGDTWGAVDVPSIGSRVYVEFQQGRLEFGFWSPAAVDTDVPEVLRPNYPDRRGRVLKNGALWWYDEESGVARLSLPSGLILDVDAEGRARLQLTELTINASDKVTVNCPDMKFNGHFKVNGNVDLASGHVRHNGTNIGDTHVHGGVERGGGSTDGPQSENMPDAPPQSPNIQNDPPMPCIPGNQTVTPAKMTWVFETVSDLKEAHVPPTVRGVEILGYYDAMDGGGARYKRVFAEPSHPGKLQSADGAWWELVTPEANPLQFGADRAAANQNAAIQAAFAYAKAKGIGIFIPAGLWTITATLPVFSYMSLRGEGGARKTIVRLADGVNAHVLKGELVDTYWASNPFADGEFEGDNFWDISDITFDGNRDNQTQGAGLQVWGRRWSMRNVVFQNIKDEGITTKFNDGVTPLGMEARLDNIIIDRCGKDGWYFAGPHDSTINGFIVIDAGLNAHNTYAALRVVAGGNGRFFGFHAWSRGWNAVRMRSAFLQEGGGGACSFDNSHFEGAQNANVDLNGYPCQFGPTCMFYAAWGGKNIILGSSGHTLYGLLGSPGADRPSCIGIQLGLDPLHKSGGNDIRVRAYGQEAGVVDFTNSSGPNIITITGHNDAGVAAVGVPASTDIVNMVIGGTGGGRIYANPTW